MFTAVIIILYLHKVQNEKYILMISRKRGSSVVGHLPLVLEVPGSIPARGEENFGVRIRFP